MTTRSRLALIDGDVLVYASGFASDAAAKSLYRQNNPKDVPLDDFDINEHHEPFNYTRHGMSGMIDSLIKHSEADDYRIFLSHPVNYREGFYPPYKTNRNVQHKPYWYDELKDYLLNEHPTEYSVQGEEADDALGRAQMAFRGDLEVESIIVSIDKDLDMIPGLHYNFSKNRKDDGVYCMQDPEGLQKFYTQILTGDPSDGIPGMFKTLGLKAEKRYLYPLEGMEHEEEMREYVIKVYRGDVEHVNLMGKLLWIKRDERWYDERINEQIA